MRRPETIIELTAEERERLEAIVRTRTAPDRALQRARLILLAVEGLSNTVIAQEVGLSRAMVVQWRQRFVTMGYKGIKIKIAGVPW